MNAVSATAEGSGVLVFTAFAVLDVDGDELLDPARAEVLLGTGFDVAMNPVVLDDASAYVRQGEGAEAACVAPSTPGAKSEPAADGCLGVDDADDSRSQRCGSYRCASR